VATATKHQAIYTNDTDTNRGRQTQKLEREMTVKGLYRNGIMGSEEKIMETGK